MVWDILVLAMGGIVGLFVVAGLIYDIVSGMKQTSKK